MSKFVDLFFFCEDLGEFLHCSYEACQKKSSMKSRHFEKLKNLADFFLV